MVAWSIEEPGRLLACADHCVENGLVFKDEIPRLMTTGGYTAHTWPLMRSKLTALSRLRPSGRNSNQNYWHIRTYGSQKLKLSEELRAAVDTSREDIRGETNVEGMEDAEGATAPEEGNSAPVASSSAAGKKRSREEVDAPDAADSDTVGHRKRSRQMAQPTVGNRPENEHPVQEQQRQILENPATSASGLVAHEEDPADAENMRQAQPPQLDKFAAAQLLLSVSSGQPAATPSAWTEPIDDPTADTNRLTDRVKDLEDQNQELSGRVTELEGENQVLSTRVEDLENHNQWLYDHWSEEQNRNWGVEALKNDAERQLKNVNDREARHLQTIKELRQQLASGGRYSTVSQDAVRCQEFGNQDRTHDQNQAEVERPAEQSVPKYKALYPPYAVEGRPGDAVADFAGLHWAGVRDDSPEPTVPNNDHDPVNAPVAASIIASSSNVDAQSVSFQQASLQELESSVPLIPPNWQSTPFHQENLQEMDIDAPDGPNESEWDSLFYSRSDFDGKENPSA